MILTSMLVCIQVDRIISTTQPHLSRPQALMLAEQFKQKLGVKTTGKPWSERVVRGTRHEWHVEYPSGLKITWPADSSSALFGIADFTNSPPKTYYELQNLSPVKPLPPLSAFSVKRLRARVQAIAHRMAFPKTYKICREKMTNGPMVVNNDAPVLYEAFFSPSGKVEWPGVAIRIYASSGAFHDMEGVLRRVSRVRSGTKPGMVKRTSGG
jgi:hypothetical protein